MTQDRVTQVDREIDRVASLMASMRQGKSDTPRCEAPSAYDIKWCRERIEEVDAAREYLARIAAEQASQPTPEWSKTDCCSNCDMPLGRDGGCHYPECCAPDKASQPTSDAVREKALAAIIGVRSQNAGNFERQGAVWEAYDRAVLDCYAALDAALAQEKPDAV